MILVLSAASDEAIARLAVRRGAHDYLVKGHVDAHWLPRALRYLGERKTTQEALLNSEARLRAISDASPLGILVSDAEGDCIYTNAAYRQRVLGEWHEAARGQAPFQAEVRFLRADGSVVWARLNAAAMRNGRTRGHVVILLTEIEQPQDAAQVAEKLLAALALPHLIDGHELHVTPSIGISIYPDDGIDVEILMQGADSAMYHAKASGRNNHQFFRADMTVLSKALP